MRKPLSFVIVMLAIAFLVSTAVDKSSAQTKSGGGAAAIYQKDCAKCHGADGKGIKTLEPPDFTDAKWQSSKTDKQLVAGINNGEGVMPSFKDKLTAAQITALVKHVRGFAPKAAKSVKK